MGLASIHTAIATIITFSVSDTNPEGTRLSPPTQAHLLERGARENRSCGCVQAVLQVGDRLDDLVERWGVAEDHDAHRAIILAQIVDHPLLRT